MSPLRFLARLLLPDWPRLLLATLAAVSAELSSVALIATAAWLFARAAEQPTLDALAVAIVAVRALALGRGILRYGERLLGHQAVLVTTARLRAHLYRALTPLAPAATSAFRSGDLLSRLVGDADAAQDLVLRCLVPSLAAVFCGAAAVGLCALILPAAAAAVAMGLLIAGLGVPLLVVVASDRAAAARLALHGQLAAQSVDLIHGSADLAAFGATDRQLAEANRTSAALGRAERAAAFSVASAGTAILLVQGLTTAAVASLATAAGVPAVPLTVLAVTTLSVFEILTPLPSAARTWIQVRAGARRLMRLLATPPPIREPERPVPAPTGPVSLELRGVTVRHPGADSPAIQDLDLRVRPGQRIVVLGASGSGKSTLLAALMRFVDYSGSIRLNGRELRDHVSDDVRAVITGVTQDAHLFHTSIKANISLAKPDATLDELRNVAERSKILDWIEALPRQWDTVVGENGAALSGGQRQRLLLARALLANPAVLLLDEPTEGLDPHTADLVLADLLDATQDRTTLLVTHNDLALRNTHQTLVLGNYSPAFLAPAALVPATKPSARP